MHHSTVVIELEKKNSAETSEAASIFINLEAEFFSANTVHCGQCHFNLLAELLPNYCYLVFC